MYRIIKTITKPSGESRELVDEFENWFKAKALFYGYFYNVGRNLIEKADDHFSIRITQSEVWRYDFIEL